MSRKNRFWALYGTWDGLVWGKILPRGVGTICPCFWQVIFFTKHVYFWYTIFVWRQFWKLHFLVCFWRSAGGKMTVLTVGSYHVFGENTDFLGETLLKTKSRRISHFSIVCIIDWFHHKWEIQTSLSWIYFFQSAQVPFGSLWLPLGSLGAALGRLVDLIENWTPKCAEFIKIDPPGGSQSLFSYRRPQRNRRYEIHPRIPRIRCHQLRLRTSLPHAPGVRMTWVLNKLPQMMLAIC